MANFITEDDRRIRELQEEGNPLPSDYLAIDRPGYFSAMRISIQQIVNAVNGNLSFSMFYAGAGNPDNAFGKDGDGYFAVPVDGSKLQMFQRIDGVWLSVFNLPLSTFAATTITKTAADLVEESYGGVWYLPVDLAGKDIISIDVKLDGSTATNRMSTDLAVSDSTWAPATRISGFANNAPQTITIKTI